MSDLDVQGYLRSKNLEVRTSGKEVVVACFFLCGESGDSRKKKLYVSSEHGAFSCKVCGTEGGWRQILEHYGDEESASVFRPSRRLLINAEYVQKCQDALMANERALTYLFERGFTSETIEAARLGFHPKGVGIVETLPSSLKPGGFTRDELRESGLLTAGGRDFHVGRLIIPYLVSGQVVQIRGRALDKNAAIKYATPAGDPVRLYGSDDLRGADAVLVVEGEFDRLMMKQTLEASPDVRARNIAVVAIPGAQVFPDGKEGFPQLFEDCRRVYLGFDNDSAGKQGAIKGKDMLGSKARIVELTKANDWNEFISEGAGWRDVMDLVAEADMRGKRVFSVEESARSLYAIEQGKPGIKTGFATLDALIRPGLLPGGVTTVLAKTGTGKALALDTPILTANRGWLTMVDLVVGDQVFASDGSPVDVLGATEAMRDHPCYRVSFADGESLIADAEHEWTLGHFQHGPNAATITTRQLAESYLAPGNRHRWYVPAGVCIDLPTRSLSLDPYLLGYWLGDGTARCAQITVGAEDVHHLVAEVVASGYRHTLLDRGGHFVVTPLGRDLDGGRTCKYCGERKDEGSFYNHGAGVSAYCRDCIARIGKLRRRGLLDPAPAISGRGRADGFRAALSRLGVVQNKHVPEAYLLASRTQRLGLLQGLMDSDGHITPAGRAEFCSTTLQLAEAVLALVRSLGNKATLATGVASLDGRHIGLKYRVTWTPLPECNPFRLARKADRVQRPSLAVLHRYVIDVQPVASVPVKCVQVDRADGLYLAGRGLHQTHNSILLANIAYYTRDIPAMFITLEMTKAETYNRLRRITRFHDPTLDERGIWDKYPLLGLVDQNRLAPDDFSILMEEFAEERGERPQLVFVDYLGYYARGMRGKDMYERNTNAVMQLKEVSKEHEVHTIVPSQVNRVMKEGDPISLESGRDSGAIEETSDFMFGIYRPHMAVRDSAQPGSVASDLMANILKSRHGNAGRVARLALSYASLAIVDGSDRIAVNRIEQENAAINRGESYADILARAKSRAWTEKQGSLISGRDKASGE